ncbi:DUF1549 and DUF1553 domain-containing protein [Planctomicrobium sp. SH668]|uniref:DUF1549 and DUF1553 domain-containing protein n=1 Tax=Planctomicrobium sp. SH668 TaxID=3448126 RepID=UPI003F5C3AA5
MALAAQQAEANPEPASLEVQAGSSQGTLQIRGSEDLRQLLVTGKSEQGAASDQTRAVTYTVQDEGVAKVDSAGVVIPTGSGATSIRASLPSGVEALINVEVLDFEQNRPVNFPNQVVPILTKYGCNGGGCHGAASGQNGFALSLLGFEPSEDHEHLVKESRGRRISFNAPDESLLLKKAIGALPHGGGARMEFDSPEYRLLRRWIEEGGQPGDAKTAQVASIEVFPRHRVLAPQSQQQLVVIATYTDGTQVDVSATAVYEANIAEMATVSKRGLVTTTSEPGDVAVMVRYQSQVAVFQATIPLGIPVDSLPPSRNFIDDLVFHKLKLLGLPPSGVTDDASFLRRVTLDIAGRLPTEQETLDFVADQDSAKRDVLIERLLSSKDYAEYFTNKWSMLLRNQRSAGAMDASKPGTYAFHSWIRQAIQENRPYDQFVREVLTASGEASENPAVIWYRHENDVNKQVEDVAQLFLGQRIQCAKCHHHPFERWSQADYYSMSAFFTQIGRKPGALPTEDRIFHRWGVAAASHPRTGERLMPGGLGASPVEIPPEQDPRLYLADWMTSPENPYFAKSLVNRYWKHFLGRGLVDPEDDMRATNPAVNPELLAALESHFIQSGFDMKDLIRTICQSTSYQLSSEPNQYNEDDRQNFSRFYPRRLPAEVLLDSVDSVTGTATRFSGVASGARAVELPDSNFPSYFLSVFGRPQGESVCECERENDSNLSQSLHLINSNEVAEKVSSTSGNAFRLANEKESSLEDRIQKLYLIAYSRIPTPEEMLVVSEYLKSRVMADGADNPQAFEDVVWSLMNTKEFLFNH